ncbi:hypothetical protein JCM9279_007094 [Rhodotorula babjevae]
MPVGHERINAREAHPNDNIVFISVLEDLPDADQAKKILDALAAQFKPIMTQWGFGVNSLREHEWNPTFAGRNWNAGEVIEIVLRRRDGSFAPYQFLLYVMCHELAHVREMNHSHAFQSVNKQLREALSTLRAKGYYGDGFWSSGRSLKYATAAVPLTGADEPAFTCGGANKKRRRRRQPRAPTAGPSKPRGAPVAQGATGRQTQATSIAAKPGARVSRKGAFPEGGGQTLSADPAQSSFKRRSQAKGAVNARAEAAQARLDAEKRAQAAAARASAAASTSKAKQEDKKPRIKTEAPGVIVLDDSDDDDGQQSRSASGSGGEAEWEWESDAEDDEVKFKNDDERHFLEDDMRDWATIVKQEDDAAERAEQARAAKAQGSSSSSSGKKGKGKASSPPSSSRKRRASASALQDDSLDALDLTPHERAMIEADERGYEDEADGVERVGKKGRVAYMAVPGAAVGGGGGGSKNKKGKGKAPVVKRRFQTRLDSDDDDSDDEQSTGRASSFKDSSMASSSVKGKAIKRKRESTSPEESDRSSPSTAATTTFASSSSAARPTAKPSPSGKKKLRPLDLTSSSPVVAKVPVQAPARGGTGSRSSKDKGKGKAVRAPSSSSSSSDGGTPTIVSKPKPKPKASSKPVKKPRKTRSDKGKKRGPYKPRARPAAAARRRDDSSSSESGVEPLNPIERIKRERETEDVELDWTDEEPAETRRRLAEAQGRRVSGAVSSPKKSKDKGKGRALQPRGSLDVALEPLPNLDPLAPLASDASSICDLPSPLFPTFTIGSDGTLVGGFIGLSTPDRARALAHLEAQVVFNDRVEAQRAARTAAHEGEEQVYKAAAPTREQEARARLMARVEEEAKRNAAARALANGTGAAASMGDEVAAAGGGPEGEAQGAEVVEDGAMTWRCGKCEVEVSAASSTCTACEALEVGPFAVEDGPSRFCVS